MGNFEKFMRTEERSVHMPSPYFQKELYECRIKAVQNIKTYTYADMYYRPKHETFTTLYRREDGTDIYIRSKDWPRVHKATQKCLADIRYEKAAIKAERNRKQQIKNAKKRAEKAAHIKKRDRIRAIHKRHREAAALRKLKLSPRKEVKSKKRQEIVIEKRVKLDRKAVIPSQAVTASSGNNNTLGDKIAGLIAVIIGIIKK